MAVDAPGRDSPFHEEAKVLLGAVLPALAIVLMLRVVVVGLYRVPSESMTPTIHVGDCLLGDKLGCRFGAPEVGDVITFESSEEAGVTVVKRVVTTEGQVIELRDGRLCVDGTALDDTYVYEDTSGEPAQCTGKAVTYPHVFAKACVWGMGDNRANSHDS